MTMPEHFGLDLAKRLIRFTSCAACGAKLPLDPPTLAIEGTEYEVFVCVACGEMVADGRMVQASAREQTEAYLRSRWAAEELRRELAAEETGDGETDFHGQ